MTIKPSDCAVFVQVWVDVNGLQQGSTSGCYAVSNRVQGSTGQGTAKLTTQVVTGSLVCWSVVPVDPQYNGQFSITAVGTEFGWSQPPAPVPEEPNVFTGQVEKSTVNGNINSNIQFSFNGGGNAITVTLPVAIVPVTA
jgi:hypothetical protein